MRMPNQTPGRGGYSDDATIPGGGFDYDDPMSPDEAMYGGGVSGEYQDAAGEDGLDDGDGGEGYEDETDESDDLYGPGDDELYDGEEEPDILESPRRIGED
jgi:hypothetical protein